MVNEKSGMIDKQNSTCYHEVERVERGFYMAELLNKVTIITRKEMLDQFRDSMYEIGVSGMKVAMVKGCRLSSHVEPKEEETEFFSKVRIEILVSDEQLSTLIDTAYKVFMNEGKE